MENASIIVGRDRAHVRELLQQDRWAEVISASAFFDKVRSLAFIYDPDLRRDDYAPLIFAQNVIARTNSFPLFYARNCATLYSSFYHGTMSPNEVYQRLLPHNPSYLPVVQILDAIDGSMKEHSLVNGVSALYAAWQIIERHKIVPLSLHNQRISLRSLIDLTALEIEVIKSLSRCGIHFDICFPLDFEKRSFNVPVDHAARHFEKAQDLNLIDLVFESLSTDGPLSSLVSGVLKDNAEIRLSEEHCSITMANSILDEAYGIAQKIAHIKTNFEEQTIALVVRTIDERSSIYKRALLAHAISVKDRKGIPLTETPAGIFLNVLFAARESSLSRDNFVSLISYPISCFVITDSEQRGQIISLLRDLGIDESAMVPFGNNCRFQYAIDTAKRVWAQDEARIHQLSELCTLLEKINSPLSSLKSRARLDEYLDVCLFLIANCFLNLDGSVEVVASAIKKIKNSTKLGCESEISWSEFKVFIVNELKVLTIAHIDQPDVFAVEFLMLPELLGRKFDHVFIADISFGRMPQNISPDPLLSDEQRIHLNKLLEKEVLKVFFDDPFEPMVVPPRQALEPFWFASTLLSAERSIHFSCAHYDQNGSEQAGSEFFIWLSENVTIEKTKSPIPNYLSTHNARFLEGKKAYVLGDRSHDCAQALWQRKRMFREEKSGPFAGEFSKSVIEKLFEGRIGNSPHRPLTPTMLESFGACAFYGLFHRMLKIEKEVFHNDELDYRALGQIAHKALQNYFTPKKEKGNFSQILEQVSKEYLEKNFVARPDVFYCQIEGLDYLLKRLIHNLSENYPSNPYALEMPFGLGKGHAAVPIFGKNRKYYLGGVVDRIDKTGASVSIIDYKLSSVAQLRLNASESALLKSNFQIPIYMRLVASLFSHYESLEFFYASIRDGEIVRVLRDTHEELMKKILNDNEEGSLAHAIENILSPIEDGQLIARISERCSVCDMHSVCRKAEA